MEMRYRRNIPAISEAEQKLLGEKRVMIVGCGGLGGYLIEYMARLGVGEITAVDGDVFEESNLNRQLVSSVPLLGKSKVQAARERASQIAPGLRFCAVEEYFDESNADRILDGQDIVLDGLDNVATRLLLESACAHHGLTLVHGAVQGWTAQIGVVPPGSGMLSRLYTGKTTAAADCLAFTPALCAAIQTAEAVKLLCGRSSGLSGKLLTVDMEQGEQYILTI